MSWQCFLVYLHFYLYFVLKKTIRSVFFFFSLWSYLHPNTTEKNQTYFTRKKPSKIKYCSECWSFVLNQSYVCINADDSKRRKNGLLVKFIRVEVITHVIGWSCLYEPNSWIWVQRIVHPINYFKCCVWWWK